MWLTRGARQAASSLSNAADQALRTQRRVARRRAAAASIPMPIGREDTTPVIALVPKRSSTEYSDVRRPTTRAKNR